MRHRKNLTVASELVRAAACTRVETSEPCDCNSVRGALPFLHVDALFLSYPFFRTLEDVAQVVKLFLDARSLRVRFCVDKSLDLVHVQVLFIRVCNWGCVR